MFSRSSVAVLLVAIALGITSLGPGLLRFATVAGAFRNAQSTKVQDASHFVFIDDTVQCEDIHHHRESNLLFLACEDNYDARFEWCPPLGNFHNSSKAEHGQGSIHIVDPETKVSRRLAFENFSGPFNTHGIDVISDPDTATEPAVFIFAVNHVPDASTCAGSTSHQDCVWRASSRVEVFRHVLGTSTVTHLRSVKHPLVKTPNDILAVNPTSFYVTNDYYYQEGLMRQVELVLWPAKWSTAIFVEFRHGSNLKSDEGVTAKVALDGYHNLNGLGRGRAGEIIVNRCTPGTVELGRASPENQTIQVLDTMRMESTVDNPSYFTDPYADDKFDGSGYVFAGLTRAIDVLKTGKDPKALDGSMVWFVPTRPMGTEVVSKASDVAPRLMFEDDGRRLRFITAAVLVGIDPKLENGQHWAWLFGTGFLAKGAVAVKVNLEALV